MMTGDLYTYQFDDVLVEPNAFRVSKADQPIHLEPKAFELLLHLLKNPGALVTKEEILNSVWNNAFVTPNALTRVVAQLRKMLGDNRTQPRYIETVQTRGYRFLAPVECLPTTNAFASDQQTYLPTPLNAQPHSLAVLPLENLSGDASQEFFVDGLTEELIAQIAKLNLLRVTSRTSVMQYKQTRKTVPLIAEELKVGLILEGSVMRVGNRVRITAQLIRAENDSHLWAESYERTIDDVFALHQEVTRSISSEIKTWLQNSAAATV